MARKGKQISRKRKAQMPEEDEKQNEMILEEVLSISGKNAEKADGSPPARLKRSANKTNEVAVTQPKKLNAKKRSDSPSTLPSKQKKSADEEVTNVGNEVKASISERGDPVPNLPDGWRRQVAVRKSGKSAGQIDIYFFSPDGIKLRSRPDVSSYLKKHKSTLKLEDFDFSKATAKTSEAVVKKKAAAENSTVPKKKIKTVDEEKSKVGVEPADLSKNISTKESKSSEKVSSEEPPVPDTEEKEIADEKTNKAVPEEKTLSEMNGKEKKNSRVYNSTTRKNKIEPLEDEKQNEVEISSKKLEKEASSSTKLKRSGNKANEVTSTQPKKQRGKKSNGVDVEANTVVNAVKTSVKGDPVPNLPDGWRKEVVVRKSGERVGQIDIYFYSPDGIKLRSRPDVASYLKKHKCNLKLEDFDFSRIAVVKKKASAENHVPKKKSKAVQEEVPDEKNSDTQKSSKILRKILESKPKKSRR